MRDNTPDKMIEIVDRVKARRLELGYSFQELADKTGLSKSTLQRYESGGIKNIPLDKLKDLADGLRVSQEWIMGLDDDNLYRISPEQIASSTDHGVNEATLQYYLDTETAKKAQEIYEDRETRILLDAKRDLKKEDLDYIVGLVKRLKGDK